MASGLQRSVGNAHLNRMALQREVGKPEAPKKLPSSVTGALSSSSGQPLPPSARTPMEQSFGTDLSGVRVHTREQAAQASKDINATAFTHGQDIYFGEGKYQPGTGEGEKLLAHELTHTIQQEGNGGVQTKSNGEFSISQPGDPMEREADQVTDTVTGMSGAKQPKPPSSLENTLGERAPGMVNRLLRQLRRSLLCLDRTFRQICAA